MEFFVKTVMYSGCHSQQFVCIQGSLKIGRFLSKGYGTKLIESLK